MLTSGGEPTAMRGRHRICELVQAAGGAIEVMACGGVRVENVEQIFRATGVREFHAALRSTVESPMKYQRRRVHLGAPGLDENIRRIARTADVRKLQQAIERAIHAQDESEQSAVSNAI